MSRMDSRFPVVRFTWGILIILFRLGCTVEIVDAVHSSCFILHLFDHSNQRVHLPCEACKEACPAPEASPRTSFDPRVVCLPKTTRESKEERKKNKNEHLLAMASNLKAINEKNPCAMSVRALCTYAWERSVVRAVPVRSDTLEITENK